SCQDPDPTGEPEPGSAGSVGGLRRGRGAARGRARAPLPAVPRGRGATGRGGAPAPGRRARSGAGVRAGRSHGPGTAEGQAVALPDHRPRARRRDDRAAGLVVSPPRAGGRAAVAYRQVVDLTGGHVTPVYVDTPCWIA